MQFLHQKGKGKNNIPLLFCHSWPGSFPEVMKILPLLTQGDEDAVSFDIVAPSLPNYGFSDGAKKRDFGTPQYAEAIHKVMLNLGYEKYGELSYCQHQFLVLTRNSDSRRRLGWSHYSGDWSYVPRSLSRVSYQFYSYQ